MLVFVAGWLLMVIAMMLPTTLPLVNLFYALDERLRLFQAAFRSTKDF